MKKLPLLLFLFIVLTSAFMNGYNHYGDMVEKAIAMVTPLLTYAVIIALFVKFKGVDLFSRTQLRVMAVLYVIMVLIEYGYPMIIYRDQTLPPDYLTFMSLQFTLNVIIARTIINE
ncbi:hypothetical protein GCM10007938_08650 [Vibrio zhanjiangensis]|uniref:Uncharacterized protein n=1 Tax=Vibrio zhanjiangensis TaxID=1046128 RepID=A0ABQ6EV71_9VIBR|nr:hypothetical protein [Vibrio zhanjiangensis]GLT17088.1 hypothetical protein GCM10007938_08650 [Vibrio zhanjiangensis]